MSGGRLASVPSSERISYVLVHLHSLSLLGFTVPLSPLNLSNDVMLDEILLANRGFIITYNVSRKCEKSNCNSIIPHYQHDDEMMEHIAE